MEKIKCVLTGRKLEPCKTLVDAFGPLMTLSNFKTHEITAHLAVAKVGDFKKRGIVLSFCPFCGERAYPEEKEESK